MLNKITKIVSTTKTSIISFGDYSTIISDLSDNKHEKLNSVLTKHGNSGNGSHNAYSWFEEYTKRIMAHIHGVRSA